MTLMLSAAAARDQQCRRPDITPIPADSSPAFIDYLLGYFVRPSNGRQKMLLVLAPLLAVLGGALLPFVGLTIGAGMVGAAVVSVLVWNHPPIAGYVMIAGAPFVVGFSRDQVLPVLRPNEALLLGLCALLALRWLIYSRRVTSRLNRLDKLVVMIVVTGFVLPLLTQTARLKPVGVDDVFYALVFIKIALLYGLIRHTIRTPGQVRAASAFAVIAGTGMGAVGVMDSLNLLGTADKLVTYFPNDAPVTDDGRGAAFIGNPIGYGMFMSIAALIAISMLFGNERPRRLLGFGALVCTVGVFGSGQIGPTVAFLCGVGVLAYTTKSIGRLFRMAPVVLLVASLVLVPLGQRRIRGFEGTTVTGSARQGIVEADGDDGRTLFEANPGSSWDVRMYNLRTFFVPELNSASNLLMGVSPQARVVSPREGEDFVWIESGLVWLIWTGGVPLFVTWFAFLGVGAVTARRRLLGVAGPIGIASAAALASLVSVGLAMFFDPHITLRGSADLLYPLLALMMTGCGLQRHKNQSTQEVFP